MRFQGSLVAIVTPMKDGKVDLRALRDLVEWQLFQGTDGIVPCGTTGEGVTLTVQERAPMCRRRCRYRARLPRKGISSPRARRARRSPGGRK